MGSSRSEVLRGSVAEEAAAVAEGGATEPDELEAVEAGEADAVVTAASSTDDARGGWLGSPFSGAWASGAVELGESNPASRLSVSSSNPGPSRVFFTSRDGARGGCSAEEGCASFASFPSFAVAVPSPDVPTASALGGGIAGIANETGSGPPTGGGTIEVDCVYRRPLPSGSARPDDAIR
jgi:hypothetical protein